MTDPLDKVEAGLAIQNRTNQRLLDAIERVKGHKMTPQEVFEQRVSFVSEGRDKDAVRQRLIEAQGYPAEASERTAVVAWLRKVADTCPLEHRLETHSLADMIEDGVHLRATVFPEPEPSAKS